MRETKILLIEGRRAGNASYLEALRSAGYAVDLEVTGDSALQSMAEKEYEVIVFDASSMRTLGWRTCQRLRREHTSIPIIHCRSTVESDMPDTSVLEELAPVTLLKQPFTTRKLVNRIKAVLPPLDADGEIVEAGPLKLYHGNGSVLVNGKGLYALTPKLGGLLETLIAHKNEVVERAALMQAVWNTDYVGDTRTLDVHIRWLRKIVEEDPSRPRLIKTVRGHGYMLRIDE